jgi:hypothetical protein
VSARTPEPCEGIRGDHVGPVRFYRTGWRCNTHSPWAEAGQPEPKPSAGPLPGAWTTPSPISDSRVHDARAIASGKRRSNPQTYRAAQAAVRHETT